MDKDSLEKVESPSDKQGEHNSEDRNNPKKSSKIMIFNTKETKCQK